MHNVKSYFKIILLGCLLIVSSDTFGQKSKMYGGIYSYKNADSSTGFIEIYPESDSTMFFYIVTGIIHPNLQLWRNFGLIILKDNYGTYYRTNNMLGMDCMLSFEFGNGKVIIKSIEEHKKCLCAPYTHPEGIFYIKNKEIPKYFIYGKDTILFDRVALNSWEE